MVSPSEAVFAKIVETENGPAILVAGRVMRIVSSSPVADTEMIVSALRSGQRSTDWFQRSPATMGQQGGYCGTATGGRIGDV